jgi:hypothetical protein
MVRVSITSKFGTVSPVYTMDQFKQLLEVMGITPEDGKYSLEFLRTNVVGKDVVLRGMTYEGNGIRTEKSINWLGF